MSGIGVEDNVVSLWLTSLFEADGVLPGLAVGGVWSGPAEPETSYPIIRFSLQSSIVVRGVGTTEIMVNMLWHIRAVCEGASFAPVTPIASRIHTLIQGINALTVTDGTIVSCVREQALRLESIQAGRDFRSLGGIYRIYVQP